MGHVVAKDVYRQLGTKLDQLTLRTPWNDTLRGILQELYSKDEADLVVRMPHSFSSLKRIQEATKIEEAKLQNLLEGLCSKGLIIDIPFGETMRYMPSPMVIGIFEFTMMRTGGNLDRKKMAELFSEYLSSMAMLRMVPMGLAMPCPAMSGALPWMGS